MPDTWQEWLTLIVLVALVAERVVWHIQDARKPSRVKELEQELADLRLFRESDQLKLAVRRGIIEKLMADIQRLEESNASA